MSTGCGPGSETGVQEESRQPPGNAAGLFNKTDTKLVVLRPHHASLRMPVTILHDLFTGVVIPVPEQHPSGSQPVVRLPRTSATK